MKTQWNKVIILSIAQSLFQTSSIIVFTISGMVGLNLASNKSLATLPIGMMSLGTAMMMIPASFIIKKIGQRKGFMSGIAFGLSGGLLASYAIVRGSFPLFVMANMMIGFYQGFSQYYRFAAADAVTDENKGKAISFVLAGGVVAAIAGPNLARFTQHVGPVPFAYCYLSIAILSVCALAIIFNIQQPKVSLQNIVEDLQPARSLREIVFNRLTISALISSAVGYSVMNMVMTATPLAMHHSGHNSDDAAMVIQWHVLGMFVPSFFTGTLIKRFGVHRIIITGIIILFIHVSFAISGTDFMHFVSGLILLGIGWNFMFIGGTTLLTQAYRPQEKAKTQAMHDFFVFTVISASGFSAGNLLNAYGWKGVNLAVIPLLVISLTTMVINSIRKTGTQPRIQ
ncbi:MFS transporter [Chitinophaga pinensis]|uniref:Major facilitator superfamily MFS_1 n=1 Tax=Chitinophaga pinensis (strain ATCC 43595 / DSM 2588 / LMG 13176 / NBRC 15968 / NCIMB 11800 / UQM 2034) TaxID=485918 RepID=A0A979GYT2_CHIPD|nr:MFS transporter [Chitinophaga pinensis]ACU63396.1 major facilitator superfamily MFS_1 [Chitinophaga pinensis DSM 2588]